LSLTRQSTNDQPLRCSANDLEEVVSSISWVESYPVTTVRIDSLDVEGSPRLGGEDLEHIRLLAEAGGTLPPITVHQPTMRVIDGVHRVRAAILNGTDEIDARLLDCDEKVAFVVAVKANITHGLPLSQSDRVAAAARIIEHHPQWSDRAVAAAAGLSGKTVSKVRIRSTADIPQSNARLGKDGRLRPLDPGARRRQAAAMFSERPEAGLREVARATGLSAATVRDVRQRIDRGEDPVPGRYRTEGENGSAAVRVPMSVPAVPRAASSRPAKRGGMATDRHLLLAKLRHDPSLRSSEAGRATLHWLHNHTVDFEGLETLGRGLPDRWAPVVAGLARGCATAWIRLAEQLEQRTE
jgi:ParB-like chromosome segregation protein Spo0J